MGDARVLLSEFIDEAALGRLLATARAEDLGEAGVDVTSVACVPEGMRAQAAVVPREDGVISGLAVLPRVVAVYDAEIELELLASDGDTIQAGQVVAKLEGNKRSILAAERVALNLLGHLSGIATQTARYVQQTRGTRAVICDTRKTLPGLRGLEKYAVACGGGTTHRLGLYDAMLIKDNHLTHLPADGLEAGLDQAIAEAKRRWPGMKFVEVEVDTLEQLKQVLTLQVDYVLLDNMPPEMMREAAAMRDAVDSRIKLEASGGINLSTVRAVAESGVDRISVGALTHSAKALDLGLDMA